MCGILSYYKPEGINREELESCLSALQKMKDRGPDGEGVMLFNIHTGEFATLKTKETPTGINCDINDINEVREKVYHLFLGHRRLKIIDLSLGAHQPMRDNTGELWIIFNGEIYNYLELREELKKLNHQFKSNSDTEVILESYKEWGTECFNKFNGMWSIIIWNIKKKELLISNDRYGIKPLYYYEGEKELIFGSEIKSFFSFPNRIKEYDKSSIDEYLNHGYINYNSHTFFNDIKKFPFAQSAILRLSVTQEFKPIRYYDITKSYSDTQRTQNDYIEEFKYLIKDAVNLTLRSDVPLGVAISGGLDSSYILYTAAGLLNNEVINTYSAIFPGSEGDESTFINMAVQGINCHSHYTRPMDEFSFEDFENHIKAQEYPVQSTSFYADWCVSRLVRNSGVKILLNGQGADELFGGYHHHFYKYCSELILNGQIREYRHNLKEFCSLKRLSEKKIQSIVINNLKQHIKGLFKRNNTLHDKWTNSSTLEDLLNIDLSEATLPAYLKSNDRNSMAFSIESRLPFLDYRLVDFSLRLPSKYKIKDGWQKWILREAGVNLPESIRYRKDKKGFTTPEEEWIRKYEKEFNESLSILESMGIQKTKSFRHYAMALWMKQYKPR